MDHARRTASASRANALARAGVLMICAGGCCSTAYSQSDSLPDEVRVQCAELTKPGAILSIEQGRTALDQLDKLSADTAGLPPEDRVRLLRALAVAHLAVGDAKRAADRAAALATDAAGAIEALETIWLVAIANGNAQQADEAGRQLAKSVDGDAKRTLAKRRRQLKAVARPPLPAKFNTNDGRIVSLAEREGGALVIDVWSLREQPPKPVVEALNALRTNLAGQSNIDMLSVNVDAQVKRDPAEKSFAESGHTWPLAFAAAGEGDAELIEAFDAGLPAWQAVIDRHGFVRAVGDVREPAFQYAVRAAHAEARDEFESVLPRSSDGKHARLPQSDRHEEVGSATSGGGQPAAPQPQGKPSDPEAASMLRQARAFHRTGNVSAAKRVYEEIIEKYPATREAEQAAEYLTSIP